jgi:hypothetical protein
MLSSPFWLAQAVAARAKAPGSRLAKVCYLNRKRAFCCTIKDSRRCPYNRPRRGVFQRHPTLGSADVLGGQSPLVVALRRAVN